MLSVIFTTSNYTCPVFPTNVPLSKKKMEGKEKRRIKGKVRGGGRKKGVNKEKKGVYKRQRREKGNGRKEEG